MSIITCDHACFSFPRSNNQIIKDLSFQIEPGELVAILGKNGSGKTTLMRLLVGLLRPTSGTIALGDILAYKRPETMRSRMRVLFENKTHLFSELTVKSFLEAYRLIYSKGERMPHIIEDLGVHMFLPRVFQTLSLGERKRVELAAIFQTRPEVIFLDEPMIGLDREGRHVFRTLLETLRDQGVTIVFTTHDQEDLTLLRPRCITIENGMAFDSLRERL